MCGQESGKTFCKTLVKFSDPVIYRDALREVEERINGKFPSPPKPSNYSFQPEPREKQA